VKNPVPVDLDELLTRLGKEDATAARVAHLHLFGVLSVEEAGAALSCVPQSSSRLARMIEWTPVQRSRRREFANA